MTTTTTNYGWTIPSDTDLVTNGASAMRTLGQGIDTSLVGLKGGTTGQILSKTSGTDMAFTWITNDVGDITAVTTTAPLQGGASSGAVALTVDAASTTAAGVVQLSNSTSTTSSILAATPTAVKSAYDLAAAAIPKTLTTTTGDIIYASAANTPARLGIGSSAQVLTVASGIPSWATPASGGGMTLISTTTMNAGNFTLSSIAGTYKHLKLVLVDVYLNTAAEYMWIRCNGDTGSNYQRRQYTNNAGTLSGGTTIQTNHLIGQAGASNTNITNGFANIDLYNYTATSGGQLIVSQQSGYDSANLWGMLNTGVYNKSAAITSITVGANNSFAGGTCLFYGVS